MNKILLYPALILLFAVTACSKLEEEPYSLIYTDNFYKTGADAEAALISAYSAMADFYFGPAATMIADCSSDQIFPRSVVGRNTFPLFNYDPNYTSQKSFARISESPLSVWQSAYSGIEKVNWIILKVPETKMDATRKTQLLGEAYFLRAFFHWMLTKNFGEVPVKIEPSIGLNNAVVGKSDKSAIYGQIYSDLDEAAERLPSYSPSIAKGRPSREVALALHAKAALYNEDWSLAITKAQQVLGSKKYSLLPNVKDLYDVTKKDLARQEIMWAFESSSVTPGKSSQITGLYAVGPEYAVTSYGSLFAYQAFFNSFDVNDKRRQLLDTNCINGQGIKVPQKSLTPISPNAVLVKKYMCPHPVVSNLSDCNIPILRLADVYLIAAEAEARQNGPTLLAYNYMDTVRQRAGLPNIIAGLGKDDFVKAVLQERSWELFAEADRWYDLTRTNTFMQVIPLAVNNVFPVRSPQPKHQYFPIPQDEINANPKLEQNPLWR